MSRGLANETLTQDKNKLAGLLDASGPQDGRVPAPEAATSASSATADPQTLRKVEAMREHVRRPPFQCDHGRISGRCAPRAPYSRGQASACFPGIGHEKRCCLVGGIGNGRRIVFAVARQDAHGEVGHGAMRRAKLVSGNDIRILSRVNSKVSALKVLWKLSVFCVNAPIFTV